MSTIGRASHAASEEFGAFRPRLQLALLISRVLPDLLGNRLRVAFLRLAGVAVGQGTVIGGGIWIAGAGRPERRLTVGARGWVNAGCYFDASDRIDIGNDVAIGQQVLVLTQTHELGQHQRRAGALRSAPVKIGDGCWIGARALILPGVSIGAGSVVAAGAVVIQDVPPDVLVAGVPTKVIRPV